MKTDSHAEGAGSQGWAGVVQRMKQMLRLPSKLSPTVLFVGVAVLSAPLGATAAITIFRHPGTMCRWYGVVGNDTYFNPSGMGANGLENTSSTSKYVTCPMITEQYNKGNIDQANFFVTDTSGSCLIYRRSYAGGGVATWAPTTVDDGFGYSWQSGSSFWSCDNYTCSMYCNIPGHANVNSYAWVPE